MCYSCMENLYIVRLVLRSTNCFIRIDMDAFLTKTCRNNASYVITYHARVGSRFVALDTIVFLPLFFNLKPFRFWGNEKRRLGLELTLWCHHIKCVTTHLDVDLTRRSQTIRRYLNTPLESIPVLLNMHGNELACVSLTQEKIIRQSPQLFQLPPN
jgi:hypothetical protein